MTTTTDTTPTPGPKPRRSILRRLVMWIASIVAVVVVLVCIAVGVVVAYLQPGRLTPMVNKYASQYLLADVKAGKVELTYWKSFPRLTLQIDSLTIDSRALDSLNPAELDSLPADAKRLLSVDTFIGSLNISKLAVGTIHIYDVKIHNPRLNLVKVNDTTANYLILPPSKEEEDERIPDIILERFAITGDAPMNYYDAAAKDDIRGRLTTLLTRDPEGEPLYTLVLDGSGTAGLGPELRFDEIPFSLNGNIGWSASDPYTLSARKLKIRADNMAVEMDGKMSFADSLTIHDLELRAADITLDNFRRLLPTQVREQLAPLHTDLTGKVVLSFTEPYHPEFDSIPSMHLAIDLDGELSYERFVLPKVSAKLTADIDGRDLNASVIDIDRLFVRTSSGGFEMKGKVIDLFTNPYVDGTFRGGIDLARLPRKLMDLIPFRFSGLLTGNTRYRFHISDLNDRQLHHVKVDGDVKLKNFSAEKHDSALVIFATKTTIKFGTSSTLALPAGTVDSLLVASVFADTLAVHFNHGKGFVSARGIQAGIGLKNISTTRDSTIVNPIGGKVTASNVIYHSHHDTITVRMRDMSGIATIRRYKGNARQPEMSLSVDAPGIRYTDPLNRATLNDSHIDFSLRLRAVDSTKILRLDSIRVARAAIATDSLRVGRRARGEERRLRDSADIAEGKAVYIDVDKSFVRWLRHHEAEGAIKARNGRLMSRFFPLGCRMDHLSLRMTTDSLCLDTLHVKAGSTSMNLTGTLSNITRAMASVRSSLNIDFKIIADTLDINGIAEGIFAGNDFAAKRHTQRKLVDDDSDDDVAADMAKHAKEAKTRAVVIPSNIEANLQIDAANVLYSDIWFQRLTGSVGLRDGALNLDQLSGYTPIGSMDLTALYQAPSIDSLRFAAGIVIRRLQLNRFLKLIPQIDSLMPLLRDVDGTITADLAMSTELDSLLDLKFHTLDAVIHLEGDSLGLHDTETFRNIAKWLMFRHKDRFVIDHMDVSLMVRDSRLDLFPFVFDIDRYKIGVSGSNDLKLNLNYHIAVLKSPIPFKFGINIKGRPHHLHFSLGRAHFDEYKAYSQRELTDTARINLIHEIENVFKFGVSEGRRNLTLERLQRPDAAEFSVADTLSRADSLLFIEAGALPPVIKLPADTLKP